MMKSLLVVVSVISLLLLVGFALANSRNGEWTSKKDVARMDVVSTVQTNSRETVVTPTDVAQVGIPDKQLIPIHSKITSFRIDNESYAYRRLSYLAPVEEAEMHEFYRKALGEHGWHAVNGAYTTYSWTDPLGVTPWHLDLDVSVTPAVGGGSDVLLIYYRWPDVSKLPIYHDAQQIEKTSAQIPQEGKHFVRPLVLTTTTYLTNAKIDDIRNYYYSNLPPYGWEYWSGSTAGGLNEDGGDTNIVEPLEFASTHIGSYLGQTTIIALALDVITEKISEDLVRVKLIVKETETITFK
jgi:hypothetical protein